METATEVVRKRIDELGTREPTIVRQGTSRIVVQVPGLQNPQALKDLLGKTAKLEFKLVDDNADPALVAKNQAPIGDVVLPYVEGGGLYRAEALDDRVGGPVGRRPPGQCARHQRADR